VIYKSDIHAHFRELGKPELDPERVFIVLKFGADFISNAFQGALGG